MAKKRKKKLPPPDDSDNDVSLPDLTDAEQSALDQFETFCKEGGVLDAELDELDWYDMSIGFFIALGIRDSEKLTELACFVRYKMQYWT